MKILRFKTNLKCNGCIRAITPAIESLKDIESWKVELENPDKVLEINSLDDISDSVIESIKKAGYQINRL